MTRYIVSILKQQPSIVMSWGYRYATAIENGLRFFVDGFLFRGWVAIVYDEGTDTFTVRFNDKKGTLKEELHDVYFDTLVDVIDRKVERGYISDGEYRDKVDIWLANTVKI